MSWIRARPRRRVTGEKIGADLVQYTLLGAFSENQNRFGTHAQVGSLSSPQATRQ